MAKLEFSVTRVIYYDFLFNYFSIFGMVQYEDNLIFNEKYHSYFDEF